MKKVKALGIKKYRPSGKNGYCLKDTRFWPQVTSTVDIMLAFSGLEKCKHRCSPRVQLDVRAKSRSSLQSQSNEYERIADREKDGKKLWIEMTAPGERFHNLISGNIFLFCFDATTKKYFHDRFCSFFVCCKSAKFSLICLSLPF